MSQGIQGIAAVLSVVLDIGLAEGGIQTAFLAHLLEETVQQTPGHGFSGSQV